MNENIKSKLNDYRCTEIQGLLISEPTLRTVTRKETGETSDVVDIVCSVKCDENQIKPNFGAAYYNNQYGTITLKVTFWEPVSPIVGTMGLKKGERVKCLVGGIKANTTTSQSGKQYNNLAASGLYPPIIMQQFASNTASSYKSFNGSNPAQTTEEKLTKRLGAYVINDDDLPF